MPRDPNIQLILDANPGATEEEAIQVYDEFKRQGTKGVKTGTSGKQVTSGQVLQEQHRPISEGLSAGIKEAGTGLGETGQIVQEPSTGVLGALRTLNASAVAAGETVGTTAQNIAANIPGLGGATGAIPAGVAATANAITQMVTGPAAFRVVGRAGKVGFKALAELAAPGALREAGVEVTTKRLGLPSTTLERITQPTASGQLFSAVGKLGETSLPTSEISNAIAPILETEIKRSTQNPVVVKRLGNLLNKYNIKLTETTYQDAVDEAKDLALWARALNERNPAASKALYEARAAILDKLDTISPIIKEANRAYRLEETGKDIISALRAGSPGTKLRQLFELDPQKSKILDKQAISDILDITDKISDVATSTPTGVGRQMLSAITEPISAMLLTKPGRVMLRSSLRPTNGKNLPNALAFAVQTWRSDQLRPLVSSILKDDKATFEEKVAMSIQANRHEQAVNSIENTITPPEEQP